MRKKAPLLTLGRPQRQGQSEVRLSPDNPYRSLPKVDALAVDPALDGLGAPPPLRMEAARAAIETAREAIRLGSPVTADDMVQAAVEHLARRMTPSLRRVINATGVIVHTNLGRAPLSPAALTDALRYSTLEYDLEAGRRGSRRLHASELLAQLAGAEAALVVNNNAAAVVLMLATVASGGEVIISRGELIEIGGSFRVPEIMEASGAKLVEVGTTNKTYPRDYAAAVNENTRAILKVHPSNYRIVGFTHEATTAELAEVARAHGVPFLYDWGAATFGPLPDGLEEVNVQSELQAGVDILSFSGDKILGGPQAGLMLGSREWINRCAKHPLARALRADKLTLAALQHTLRAYLLDQADTIPVSRMVNATPEALADRARTIVERLSAELPREKAGFSVAPCQDAVGGGSHPQRRIPGMAVKVELVRDASVLANALRRTRTPVIGVVHDGALWLHVRTIDRDEEELLVASLGEAFSSLTL